MSFDSTVEGKTAEIYKTSSDKMHMLGTRRVLPDGRVYRYAKSGSAGITIGRVVGMAAQVATHDLDVVMPTARTTAQWDAPGKGSTGRTIEFATSAIATASIVVANKYDDGYIWINDEDGEGQIFQIKSHDAGTTAASTPSFTPHEEDLLTIALTTASEGAFIRNFYDDVVIHTGTTSGGIALGVAHIAVAASKYFWLQTWGPCPVIQGAIALVAGEPAVVIISTGGDTGVVGVAGSVYPPTSTKLFNSVNQAMNAPRVGLTITTTVDAEYALVYLTCAP